MIGLSGIPTRHLVQWLREARRILATRGSGQTIWTNLPGRIITELARRAERECA